MTNDQEIARLELTLEVQTHPDLAHLPESARKMLVAEVGNCPTAKDHILRGMTAPTAAQLIPELWATENGQTLRQILAEGDAHHAKNDETRRDQRLRTVEAETNIRRRLTLARQLEADIKSGAV